MLDIAGVSISVSMSVTAAVATMLFSSCDVVDILVSMTYFDAMTLLPVHVSESIWFDVAICLSV